MKQIDKNECLMNINFFSFLSKINFYLFTDVQQNTSENASNLNSATDNLGILDDFI